MTIQIKTSDADKVIEVSANGKLSKDDYERFVPELESAMAKGKVRILFEMNDFHGWDAGALWEDIKFDSKHHADIERLALVGDKKWEQWMAKVCRPFTSAEIRYFEISEKQRAEDWIRE